MGWGWEGELHVCTLGSLNFVVCKFYDYVCCVVKQGKPHSNFPVTCSCKTNEQNLLCMNKSKHLCKL